jgi:hypothetical protein
MTATRSYKKPMSVKAAREELTRSAGTHFDPAMVRAFLSVPIGRVRWTAGPIAWLAQLPFLAQIPTWGATAMMATGVVVATPLVTGVAAQEVSPDTVEVVDTGAQLSTDSEALTIQVTTTVVDASTEPGADPGADTSSSGRPLDKAPPPGKTKDTTTTTTTTTTPPVEVTTTTKPGNGKGRGNGGGPPTTATGP